MQSLLSSHRRSVNGVYICVMLCLIGLALSDEIMPQETPQIIDELGFDDDQNKLLDDEELGRQFNDLSQNEVSITADIQPSLRMRSSKYIRSTDRRTFTKINVGWTTFPSVHPLKLGYISQITVEPIRGTTHFIGLTENSEEIVSKNLGSYYNSFGYRFDLSQLHIDGQFSGYGQKVDIGDQVTIKVDLRPGQYNAEFFKNGRSMGYAYEGLELWDQVYFGITSYYNNQAIRITDMKQYKP